MKRKIVWILGMLVSFLMLSVFGPSGLVFAEDSEEIDCGIVSSFASPGPSPQGLAWDGTHLWLADDSTDTIYKINPLDGFVDFSFSSPGLEPKGLTYEGTYLWNIDNNSLSFPRFCVGTPPRRSASESQGSPIKGASTN